MDVAMLPEDILFRWEDDFAEDFDFIDIKTESVHTILFTEQECNIILSYTKRREQIKKMFSVLVDGRKNLNIFIDVLSEKYDWLAEMLKREDRSPEMEMFKRQVDSLRTELPKHFDLNVKRTKYSFELEQKLLDLQPREHLVVHGNLGYGKRYLVLDACCNYSVMKRMDFNIFWLNVGKCKTPETIFAKLQRLLNMLPRNNPSNLTFDNFDDAVSKTFKLKKYLRETLGENYKNCLLVLIDVPNQIALKSFDLQCKVLMTTRNKDLLEKLQTRTTKTVQLSQGFETDESLGLFAKVLGIPYKELPPEAAIIHRLCKGNPFLISLIAGNMKEYANTPNRWLKWKNILENTGHTDTEYHKLIKQSLTELCEEDYKRFRSLVIFNSDVSVPSSLLQLYWGKSEREVEDIIKKFDKLYFVERGLIKNETLACSLQYHYYSFLKNEVSTADKKKMHLELVTCYKILDAVDKRTEPNIIVMPDDGYFFFYIGYHIKEADRSELFPKIFLDFGFLEQKLRATGLPNTIGDLKLYRQLITNSIPKNEIFVDELLHFLKSSEEVICKSADTCMLQYAMTAGGVLQEQAIKQAQQFTDRVWFRGNDHLSKHRQIVKLPKKPYLMKFFGPDALLVALDNHAILLTDLSLSYTVEPTLYTGHSKKIIDIQIFLRDYFISLDEDGVCKVWSLKNTPNERRRSDGNRARVGARQNRYEFGLTNINNGSFCQKIGTDNEKIVCLYLIHRDLPEEIGLYVAHRSGRVIMYDWNANTHFSKTLIDFETNMQQIKTMICTFPYFIVLNKRGNISFFNLKYSSKLEPTACLEKYPHPLNVYDLAVNDPSNKYVVVVYHNKIMQIKYKYTRYSSGLYTEFTELYSTDEDHNTISCSAVSDDLKYLILGTYKGIIVFDPIRKTEELRSSVSDKITSLDICGLDNDVYKYILISGSTCDAPVINISGLNFESETMQWASDRMGSPINESNLCSQQRLNTWLVGGKFFYVNDMDADRIELMAVDSRGEVHKRTSFSNFMQSEFVTVTHDSPITVMAAIDQKYYFGYAHGFVFEYENPQPFITLGSSVEYLKCFTSSLVVASTKTNFKIRNGQEELERISRLIVKSFVTNGHLILVKDDCSFEMYNIEHNEIVSTCDTCTEIYGGCDFAVDCLIIGTKTPLIHVWRINSDPFEAIKHKELFINTKSPITCIKLNQGREYFAIGCESGSIDLYSFKGLKYLNTLQSNRNTPINDMIFSPWSTSSTLPIILATISEQICFWNISYMVNNPIENGALRRSQRFDRKESVRSITEKMQELKPINGNGYAVQSNPWAGKLGPTEKPELLSCIQLVGNAAEQIFVDKQFTKFVTVDDEGEVYYLQIIGDIGIDSNGNI